MKNAIREISEAVRGGHLDRVKLPGIIIFLQNYDRCPKSQPPTTKKPPFTVIQNDESNFSSPGGSLS
jgi:hypothetical protein